MRPGFNTCRDLWTDDGSLRDVYVRQMQLQHWDRFDSLVHQHEFSYHRDGSGAPFPSSRAIFLDRDGSHLLSVMLGPVHVNCHFFFEGKLELDISPQEIASTTEHHAVLDFVEQLALALERPVDITPENAETTPFISYSPTARSWTTHLR